MTVILYEYIVSRLPEQYRETVMSNITTNSNLINAARMIKLYTGQRPEDIADWYRRTGFILIMKRPDIFQSGRARRGAQRIKMKKLAPLLTPVSV